MEKTIEHIVQREPLNELPILKHHKQSLGHLGKNRFYTFETVKVGDLVDALNLMEERISALAVVDYGLKIKGIIVTSDLYSMMGRQFGRAILSKKMVGELAEEIHCWDYRQNIFALEEELGEDRLDQDRQFFMLSDEEQKFKGLFSTKDLLVYLSDITRKDIDLARTLQRRISREESSVHELKFDLVASSQAAKGVGGDYYSLMKTQGDNWIISVCDVSGKGVAASLLTTTIWGMMSIYPFRRGVAPFLYKVNNYIYNSFEAEKFITGIFLEFHAASGEISICDMGHSYLFMYRSGKFKKLELQGNMPIGVAPSTKLRISKIKLKPGDYLFIPTDGLLEQENSHKELFQPETIGTIIKDLEEQPIEDMNREFRRSFMEFKGKEHLHDDVTYLLLKYYDEPLDRY